MDEELRQLLTLGRSHYQRKEYERAEGYLTQVLERNQSFADVYNMLGVIYANRGEFERSRQCFEQALKLNPGYTEASLNLAVVYNDTGRYKEAKAVYDAALSRTTDAPDEMDPFVKGKIANMYADIGDAFVSSGLWDQAVKEYQHALSLGPTFVDIRMKLAGALRDGGHKEEAIAELNRVVEERPAWLPARVALGVALYAAGRADEAVATWEEVLNRSPGNKTADMYLTLVRKGASPQEVVAAETVPES